jgi:heat shock protein HslJ
MKKYGILLLICLWMGIVSSCKSVNVYKVQDLNGKWIIVSVNDEPVTLEKMPFLEFDMVEQRVHGNAGCNVLNAGFEPDSKDMTAIRFIAPITTMMACIHGMETEAKILQAFNDVTNVQKGEQSNRVKLVDKEGAAMLVLEKAEER